MLLGCLIYLYALFFSFLRVLSYEVAFLTIVIVL
jgi:hypothetical protein